MKNKKQKIKNDPLFQLVSYPRCHYSGAPRAKRARGAPWVNKFTHPRKFGNHVTDRPTDRPHHRQTNAKFRIVCECIGFGAKTKGHPRFVKHKQLKTSEEEIFRVG